MGMSYSWMQDYRLKTFRDIAGLTFCIYAERYSHINMETIARLSMIY
nr:MAG TPA: hypothetical protein [Caudoviricetes sp.]